MIDNYSLTNLAKTAGIDRYTVLREYLQIIFLDKLYQAKPAKKLFLNEHCPKNASWFPQVFRRFGF